MAETLNPLWKTPYFFFSGMYDDSLVGDFYRKIVRESYYRSTTYQRDMVGRSRYLPDQEIVYRSEIDSLTIDETFNHSIGLPYGSRTIIFDRLAIPVHNIKRYLRTYGAGAQKIPLEELISRPDIFDKYFTLQIGRYRIVRAMLIKLNDGNVVLAIPNDANSGILSSVMDTIIGEYYQNESVYLFTEPHTQIYYSSASVSSILSATATNGYYQVTVNKSSAITNISNPTNKVEANSWDCIMSANVNKYGRGVYVSCPCTLYSESSTNVGFVVDERFINTIRAGGATIRFMFVHRPARFNMMQYTSTAEEIPIIDLDYIHNPAMDINIELYRFDPDTYTCLDRYYGTRLNPVYYPNVYDFRDILEVGDTFMISTNEYLPQDTNQELKNHINKFITSCGERYPEIVHNNYGSLGLNSYHPISNYPSVQDYIESVYYGNIRGYLLDKIKKMIDTNPNLDSDYLEWMYQLNGRIKISCGTPKQFKFGGNTRGGEFTGTNQIVMDTSNTTVNVDEIYYFSEPHSYITFKGKEQTQPAANIYIDGKYVIPSAKTYYKGSMYYYLPVSIMNAAMGRFETSEECAVARPITIDIFTSSVDDLSLAAEDRFVVNAVSEQITILEDSAEKHSLNSLVFRDSVTGQMYQDISELFDISLSVTEYELNTPDGIDKIQLEKGPGISYFMTLLNEIYNTKDNVPIALAAENISLNLNDFITELNAGGVSNYTMRDLGDKDLNMKNIVFIPKSPATVGTNISVSSNRYKAEHSLLGSSAIELSDGKYSFIFENALHDNTLTSYMLFINGKFQSPDEYTIKTPNFIYGENLEILITTKPQPSDIYTLVHLPISMVMSHALTVTDNDDNIVVGYMKPALDNGITLKTIWPPDDAFVNGALIAIIPIEEILPKVFDDKYIMRFTDGFRMPQTTEDTNSDKFCYYTPEQCALLPSTSTEGLALCDKGDIQAFPFDPLDLMSVFVENYLSS